MAEYGRFFDAQLDEFGDPDREYSSDEWSEYFKQFITDGYFGDITQLATTEDTGMDIEISAGFAWLQGRMYKNDDVLSKTVPTADATNPRIDRVVIRVDTALDARSILIFIKEGTPAVSPSAPALERDLSGSGIYELSIAQIAVAAGATSIVNANITDERGDITVCGQVNSLIQVDTSGFQAQYDAFELGLLGDWNTFFNSTQSDWTTWFGDVQTNWAAWFSSAQNDIYEALSVTRSSKDSEGIFTTIEYEREDSTLFKDSILSGGTSPEYTTLTERFYASNGITVLVTNVYTLSYDGDGDFTTKVLN
jgi:hypothetical protein